MTNTLKTVGQPYVNQSNVAVDLANTPYRLIRRDGDHVILGYGDIEERWRRADIGGMAGASSPYRIVVDGIAYYFYGRAR